MGSKMLKRLGCAEVKNKLDCLQLLDAKTFVDPKLEAEIWHVQVQNDHQEYLRTWILDLI